jgi:6-phosphogluconolactonase (cycloisomerase 2 family)
MIVAHQSSGTLQVFSVDATSGTLTSVGKPVSLASPVCVIFAP